MRWSLRNQLLVPLVLLLLGVAAATAWTANAAAGRVWQDLELRMRASARTLDEANFRLTQKVLEQTRGLSGGEFVFHDADGRQTTTLPPTADLSGLPTMVAQSWKDLYLDGRVRVDGRDYLCSGVTLRTPEGRVGGTLHLLYPESLWKDTRWEAIQPTLLLGGFVGMAAVALAVSVGRQLSRRLIELERHTRRIASGDFGSFSLAGRNDELQDLAVSINEMAAQLQKLHDTMRANERLKLLGQVGGGLAHQLRNGVAGARLAVQLHARDCPSGDPEPLQVALRQLSLVEANIRRFLALGQAEESRKELCELSGLLDEAISLLQPQCRHAGTTLRWDRPARNIWLNGDGVQLGHLFLNILTNAMEAAGPGGSVECRVHFVPPAGNGAAQPSSCSIEILDSGPGPPVGIADRIFEPFVTGKDAGVGLGLAVARQAALAHGGDITWQRQGDRTSFCIKLPIAKHETSIDR